MLGRKVNIPATILYGKNPSVGAKDRGLDFSDTYLMNLLSEFHELDRNKLREAQKIMHRDYDTRNKTSIFKVVDLVHFKNPKVARPGKRLHHWDCPGVVTKIVAPWLMEVCLSPLEGDKIFHREKIKPCRDRVIPPWAKRMRDNLKIGTLILTFTHHLKGRMMSTRSIRDLANNIAPAKHHGRGAMVGCDSYRG
jgi:hypothetical protein